MTARRRKMERRLRLRRRLIKQVARRFYAQLNRAANSTGRSNLGNGKPGLSA